MIGFIDIRMDKEGDLVIDSDGDLKIADTWQTTMQDAAFRIRTAIGEYIPDKDIGSNVHSKFGEQNTRYNGEIIKTMVIRALSYDNRFERMEYIVDVVPISKSAIVIMLEFRGPFEDAEVNDYKVTFYFKYDTGEITMIGTGV